MSSCPSTHGASGYCLGSYWRGSSIICGICGEEIKNPPPTGKRWIPHKVWYMKLLGKGEWIDTYPDFVIKEEV